MKRIIRRIWKKVLQIIFTLFLVTFCSFLLLQLSPVDPAEAYVRRHMSFADENVIQEVREDMGLDLPLLNQYGRWIHNALHKDFGTSLVTGEPVWNRFATVAPRTLFMVMFSVLIQVFFILLLGCLFYLARNSLFKHLLSALSIITLSIPAFFIGSVYLDLFAVHWKIQQVTGNRGLVAVIGPSICLALPVIALFGRMLGDNLIQEMEEEYIFFARTCGLKESYILTRYALPKSVQILLPSFMQNIGFLVAGAGLVEVVFSFPGLGNLIIDSILDRDAPMIHMAVLLLAFVFLMVNLLSDAFRAMSVRHNNAKDGVF